MPPPPEIKNVNEKKDEEKEKEHTMKVWNDSEVQLLKKWGETAASYRLLHDRAYRHYYTKSYMYAVPVIVFSTITGTASFSQTLFPPVYQPYVPMVIGGINIFIGVLGTLARFFRVDELTEAHRVASVSYGKFSRNISTELSLPPQNRKYNGADLVEMCRTEMDRLIEQSPVIPMNLLLEFKNNEEYAAITKPEVLDIKPIEEYKMSKEEKVATIVSSVVEKLRQNKPERSLVQQMAEKHAASTAPRPYAQLPRYTEEDQPKMLSVVSQALGAERAKETINHELNQIANSGVVSNAKSKFQHLMKKVVKAPAQQEDVKREENDIRSLPKVELVNITKSILSNAVHVGEEAIADVELGISQACEEESKTE